MATTNKGMETPAFNSNVNTWDVPVNGNTNILDQALGSTTALNAAGSVGTVLLTNTQYRSLILSVTGLMTGNARYNIPSGVGGQWVIVNGTTGAFTLTIGNAAGGTTVDCTQGKTTLVYSDGTNVRISDDRAISSAGSAFPTGTAMLFAQTAAPTGWTKDTTHNNKALRVVSGTASSGGTTAFTSVFTSRTIAVDNLPSHTHTVTDPGHTHGVSWTGGAANSASTTLNATTINSNVTFTQTTNSNTTGITLGNTGGGVAMDFAVQYVDVIIATKDA